MQTDLSRFDNAHYRPGPVPKLLAWYFVNIFLFKNPMSISSSFKRAILRLFGAKIGRGVVIKPSVNIKYPWFLDIGDHCWIGEEVWIDNLAHVSIGSHVCISQGALLLTGNHDYRSPTFDLITRPITLENGCWIGAKSVVCPGVTARTHAVLAVGSVATTDLEAYTVYQGNPAREVRKRVFH